MDSRVYQHWMLSTEFIPVLTKAKLLVYFENSYNVFHASKAQLLESGLMKAAAADRLLESIKGLNIEAEYEAFMRGPFSFITCEDPAYLECLTNIYEPVYGFYYYGNIPDITNAVAIVGARRCSAYGKKMAEDIARALGQNNIAVISGMARGIDSFAHLGSISGGGKTVAVLGSGLDVIYPADNRGLYEKISGNGCVMSEFALGTAPRPGYFPVRNRIVSALAKTVVVIEAKEKSGSLITADCALEQGKDIYVVPGRITDSLSAGCNRLATQGAGIIYEINQFINEIVPAGAKKDIYVIREKENKYHLTKEELIVYALFDFYPKSLALVQATSNMDYLTLLSTVLTLEKKGFLTEVFKNQYIISR